MKNAVVAMLVFALLTIAAAPAALAQTPDKSRSGKSSSQTDRAAREAEKVHQKVNKLGVGDAATVKVTFSDNTMYSGHISEANDKSFTVVQKSGQSRSITYSEVKSIEGRNSSTGVKVATYAIIAAGAGVLTVLLVLFSMRARNP